jgi:DNA-binding CsgD family transcriptional regulator
VLLAGPQGVGKSRLADEALDQARDERWATDRIDGAAATAAVPLGAVAHLAPPDAVRSGDPLQVLLAIVEELQARAVGGRRPGLMIVVDDAHELDEASLAVLRRALSIPHLFLLMTVRSDAVLPTPLVTMWKDGLADRIDLDPLSRDESYQLVADAVGGEVETATLRWLWDHSLGNPLFLRELVLAEAPTTAAGAGAGADWRCVDGVWARASGRPLGRRLAEVVRSRLDTLDSSERAVLELLTVSGPLPLDQLGTMVPLAAVADVADRGLVTARGEGADTVVSLAHPLYGKVLSDGFTPVRDRALRRQLLDALMAGPGSGAGSGTDAESNAGAGPPSRDVARVAALRLDLGLDVDPSTLVLAHNLVLAAYPRNVAERLTGATSNDGDVDAAVALAEASVRPRGETSDDVELMGRLARSAWERDRTLPAGLAWVAILAATGRAEEGERLTDQLEDLVNNEWDRTFVALARANLEFWVLGQEDKAIATLSAAEDAVDDPSARRRLRNIRAGISLNGGRVEEAARLADEVVADASPTDPAGLMGTATAAAAHALAGRPRHAAGLVDQVLPSALAQVNEAPEVMGQLMLARHFAARMLGSIDEAEWIAYACHQAGVEQGSLDAMGVFTGALGHIAMDRGQAATAARRLRESEVLLRDRDLFGYRPWVLACLSASLAQLGQAESAAATYGLVRTTATPERERFFEPDIVLAEAWCHAAAGRRREAIDRAGAAVDLARRSGLASFEATALHTLVRLGQGQGQAAGRGDRLGALADAADNPLWRTYAAHARASADGDPAALSAVSTAFEEMGLLLLAAEAAAESAAVLVRRGEQTAAFRATSRAEALAAQCEGARTPALRLHTAAPTLTAREQEVAALVANGLTSKAIAGVLVLSPRTVESHLYRIFTKLGVSDRSELTALLNATTPTQPS